MPAYKVLELTQNQDKGNRNFIQILFFEVFLISFPISYRDFPLTVLFLLSVSEILFQGREQSGILIKDNRT